MSFVESLGDVPAGPPSAAVRVGFEQALQAMDRAQWARAQSLLDDCLAQTATLASLWFNRAWCRLHQGDACGAQHDLTELLSMEPAHAPALALLGRLQLADGLLQVGAATLSLAWRAAPDDADIASACLRAWLVVPGAEAQVPGICLAMARRGLLSEPDALTVARVLQPHPGSQAPLHQMWIDLCHLPKDRLQRWMFQAWAESCAHRAQHAETAVAARLWLNHAPGDIDALDLLVQALAARGDYEAALPLALERVREHPQDVEGQAALVDLLFDSMDTSARMSAARILAHALQREPANPLWWCMRGEINARLFLNAESAADFERALELDPDNEVALCGVAGSWCQQGRFDDALAWLHAHGGRDQSRWSGRMLNALGNILRSAGRLKESEAVLRAGLAMTGQPVFSVNLAFTLLTQGRYAEGFAAFLRRRDVRRLARTWHRAVALGAKPWEEGGAHQWRGRHVLVTAENGVGDTFQFVRYVPVLIEHGVRVTMAAQPRTGELLRTAHPLLQVVEHGQALPSADAVCDVHDLPGFLGADLQVPATLGRAHCLQAHPELVQRVAARLGPRTGLRVALGWRGTRSSMAERSIDLSHFARVDWGVPITWYSLQPDELSAEDREPARQLGLVCPAWSFDEAAAAMTLMDAVVSIDTVFAHLAGALGLSPIVLLNSIVDWRWDTGEASPWYPSARLIRATALDGWADVLQGLAVVLRQIARRSEEALEDGSAATAPPSRIPHDDAIQQVEGAEATGLHERPDCTDEAGDAGGQGAAIARALAQGRLEEAAEALLTWLSSDDESPGLWAVYERVLTHLAHPGVLAAPLMRRLQRAGHAEFASPLEGSAAPSWSQQPLPSLERMAGYGESPVSRARPAAVRAYALMCLQARRPAEGLPAVHWLTSHEPEEPRHWILLARMHHLANDGPACFRAAERAVVLSPRDPGARAALFLGCMATWRYDEAWDEVQRRREELSAQAHPDPVAWAECLGCEAAVWRGRGDLAQAQSALLRAVQACPLPALKGHLGELWALQGDYAAAAPAMLALVAPRARVGDALGQWMARGARPWTGSLDALRGRHLVVEADNGAGDTFQFARFLPGLVERGVRVTLRVPPGQWGLMRQLQADEPSRRVEVVTVHDDLPQPDAIVHLEPLPWILGVTLESLLAWGPAVYLRADAQRQAAVRAAWDLGVESGRLKVGVAWRGQVVGGGLRRMPLAEMAAALSADDLRPHLRLFALPIEPLSPSDELLAQQLGMAVPAWSFEDEAAALTQLDLVITVDTSHAHLAGSLGVACWVLLNHTPDWRWGLKESSTPWYPGMHLFRQERPGQWGEPLRAVADRLRAWVGRIRPRPME